VYTPAGSARGRQDFANSATDFAVSDIGYQGGGDLSHRPYAYLPLVAGGTAFPYNLVVGGHRLDNLRLSGEALAKIFTDQITNWDDPEITADNNGQQLPSMRIVPVVHSEGAGPTLEFTSWLHAEDPTLSASFSGHDSALEYWPSGEVGQVAQIGSEAVINFIDSAAGDGSIGYDESSSALATSTPVAKIENAAGYFTAPTPYNVAVSLTQARINVDQSSPGYGLEDLTAVYTYADPRTYPLSGYSYMIIPTAKVDPSINTTAKAQTLADFISYAVWKGQAEGAPVGYAPLPLNLVQAAFGALELLRAANSSVVLSPDPLASCDNPTFVANRLNNDHLYAIAPQPSWCDRAGRGPCPGSGVLAQRRTRPSPGGPSLKIQSAEVPTNRSERPCAIAGSVHSNSWTPKAGTWTLTSCTRIAGFPMGARRSLSVTTESSRTIRHQTNPSPASS
jgi:ABC-type phosphate transport system substrate-binding protein